jgi:hypothetical protein
MIVPNSIQHSTSGNYHGKSENNITSKKLQVFKVLNTDKSHEPGLQAIAANSDNQTITNQSRSFSNPNTYK